MISIVIPTKRRYTMLTRCLRSLLIQDYDTFEVLVIVDNPKNSKYDDIERTIKSDKIKFFYNTKTSGPSHCRNIALEKASGEIISFLDDDCVVKTDWLTKIDSVFEQNLSLNAICTSVLSFKSDYVGKFRSNQKDYQDKRMRIDKSHVFYCPTCCLSIRRKIISDIGFFDKSLRFSEDIDFGMRLYKSGNPIFIVRNIIIYHQYESKLIDFIQKSYQYGININIIKRKYPQFPVLVPSTILSIPPFMLLSILSPIIKLFHIKECKIKFLPLLYIDDIIYRIGVILGKYKN